MITRTCLAILGAAALMAAYSGDSFMAKFEAMPKAVQDTASANIEHALPMSISSAKGEKGVEYTINTRLDGKLHNVVINEDGKLLAVKDETDLESIPAAAKGEIEKEAGALKVMAVEKVTEGEQVSYGALMKDEAQGKYVRMRVGADGTLKAKNLRDTANP